MKKETICLTMIVRNEAPVIGRALKSVRGKIDSFSISDTGSTDDTKAIISKMFRRVPGTLRSDKWVDFSTNRNLAIASASGDWIFILDADETLEGPLVLPLAKDGKPFDSYSIKIVHEDCEFWSVRVFRNDGTWRYKGVCHEHPYREGPHSANTRAGKITSCCIVPKPGGHQSVSGNKFLGHLELFETAEKTSRNVFYHANTLRDLKRTDEAIAKYRERVAMGGWEEEVYLSLWQIARMTNREEDFREACRYRPSRCEARVDLMMILREQERYADMYALAREAVPSMTPDICFVDPNAGWRLLEEYAIAAYYMGFIDYARGAFEAVLHCPILPKDAKERTIANLASENFTKHMPAHKASTALTN